MKSYLLGKPHGQALFDPTLIFLFFHFALCLRVVKNNILRFLLAAIFLTVITIEGVLSPSLPCWSHFLC